MYPWSGLRQAPQVLSDWHLLCRIYSDVRMVVYSIKFPHIFREWNWFDTRNQGGKTLFYWTRYFDISQIRYHFVLLLEFHTLPDKEDIACK